MNDFVVIFFVQVKLRDSVVSALRFYKAKEYDVAWIDASLDLSKAKTDTRAKQEMILEGFDLAGEVHLDYCKTLNIC